jgi:hypothetical protein
MRINPLENPPAQPEAIDFSEGLCAKHQPQRVNMLERTVICGADGRDDTAAFQFNMRKKRIRLAGISNAACSPLKKR